MAAIDNHEALRQLETFIPFRVTLSFGDLEQRLTMIKLRGCITIGERTDSDKGQVVCYRRQLQSRWLTGYNRATIGINQF